MFERINFNCLSEDSYDILLLSKWKILLEILLWETSKTKELRNGLLVITLAKVPNALESM